MDLLYALGYGALLGLSLTVPPGPMNALISARATRSYREGLLTGLGAMSADLLLGSAVYFLRSSFSLGPDLRYLDAVGSLALLFFAGILLRSGRDPAPPPPVSHRVYLQALAAGITNPFQILWWLTAGLALAYLGGLALLVGLFLAVLAWSTGFPYLISLGSLRSPAFARGTRWASILVILAFSAYFAYLAVVA